MKLLAAIVSADFLHLFYPKLTLQQKYGISQIITNNILLPEAYKNI